jgi:hypothetical protein
MKTPSYLLLLTLSLFACSKHDSNPIAPPTPNITYKDTVAALPFITNPLAANRLQLTFPWAAAIAKVYLKQDTATVGTYTTIAQPQFSTYADISYPFDPAKTYSFVLETTPNNNVALRYTLHNYTHTYISTFTQQLLLPIKQSVGPNMIDISPSRKSIFVTDDLQSILFTKRVSLADGKVDSIGIFNYGPLRAISDNELLTLGFTYNGRALRGDSAVLNRYNITTQQNSFVAFINHSAYTSRIIDDHVLVAGPPPSTNAALINLADTTKLIYPSSVNPLYIDQYHFDHLYYDNQLVNPVTGVFQPVIPAADTAGIEVVDSATGYALATRYSELKATSYPPAGISQGQLIVYLHGNRVYQGDTATSVYYSIPKQPYIANNRFVFFQNFGYDTAFRVSGYYQLDLNTRKTSLLHSYSNGYVMEEFQLDAHTMISVRTDGVYRITLP